MFRARNDMINRVTIITIKLLNLKRVTCVILPLLNLANDAGVQLP